MESKFHAPPAMAGKDLISRCPREYLPNHCYAPQMHTQPNHSLNPPLVTSSRPLFLYNLCNEDFCVSFEVAIPKTHKVSVTWDISRRYLPLFISVFYLAFSAKPLRTQNSTISSVFMASSSKQPPSRSSPTAYAQPPDDEADTVLVQNTPEFLNEDLSNRMLAGKILAPRTLNRSGVKGALTQIFEDCEEVSILEGQGNIYSFTFQTQAEADMILERSPLFVLNHLMSLQKWGEAESPHQVSFDFVPFWIQIHGLPINFLNLETLKAVVNKVGVVLEIEDPMYEGSLIRTFGRARIKIDVTKPF